MAEVRTGEAAAARAEAAPREVEEYREITGWMGWNVFAATVMMIAGALQGIYGFIAIVNDDWVVWTNRGALYMDFTAWGWIHLVLGAVVLLAGVGVLTGNTLARIVGVVLATASIIANFLFLPAYPIWSLTVITLGVVVIWALTAHGHEMRDRTRERSIDLRSPTG